MQGSWRRSELGDALHALSRAAGHNIRWLLPALAGKAAKDAEALLSVQDLRKSSRSVRSGLGESDFARPTG
jgi:hypothetical protein